MTLMFQVECWAAYVDEARPLWRQHWDEIHENSAGSPDAAHMRVYEALYVEAEAAGRLCVVTARAAGVLVGWVVCFLGATGHYADTLIAQEDTFWLDRAHRSGLAGARMIRFAEQALRERGVKILHITSHANKPLDRLFLFLRYKQTHSVFTKRLEG